MFVVLLFNIRQIYYKLREVLSICLIDWEIPNATFCKIINTVVYLANFNSIMTNKFLYLFLCYSCFCFSQQNSMKEVDSLSQQSYEVLIDSFYNTSKLSRKEILTEGILQKAKRENDTLRHIIAYYFYTNIYKNEKTELRLKYIDSLIKLSEFFPDKDFPAIAYYDLGIVLHKRRDFKKATDAFVKGNEYASKYNNNLFFFLTNYFIARIKDRIGNHKEALKIHQKNTSFVKMNIEELGNTNYLRSMFALAFTHKNLRNLDSASYYNNLGLKLSTELNVKYIKYYFDMNEGVVSYFKKDFSTAKLKIESSKKYFINKKDIPNLSEAYFYLGKIAYDQNNRREAIQYFKKVDTIFTQINDLFPELRENYILLSKYYKNTENLQQQLLYTEKLNEIDSILNSNHMHISDYLKNEYDIPKIVSEKEGLIRSLKRTNRSKNVYIYITLVAIFLISSFFYRRQRIFKRRFEKLLIETKENDNTKNVIDTKEIEKEKSLLEVPEELVNKILKGLANFEADKGYLDASIKLSTLAKILETNTNYLSKTINHYKKKNINLYLNDLRVDYSIHKLQEDEKFRNYTIKAIAKEVGFKSSETFSKTFYKKTGIYPSYFIKQIGKANKG